MEHVLRVGLHTKPRADLREIGEFHAGLPSRRDPTHRLSALEVRSVPGGGHRQSQHVLRATRNGADERETSPHITTKLVDAAIAEAELREGAQRPQRDVTEEICAGAAPMPGWIA